MSTSAVRTQEATRDNARVGRVDMKLEVVTIPVSDVDRATKFYVGLGWRQDVTPPGSGIVQLTPPGSACSVQLPGRIDSGATTYGSTNDLATALRRVAAAHGQHEQRIGKPDANWPDWYAAYLVAEQNGAELPA